MIATAAILTVLAAPAPTPARPTPLEARRVAAGIFADLGAFTPNRIVVAPCRPVGRLARACRVRVIGPSNARYRVLVQDAGPGHWRITTRATR